MEASKFANAILVGFFFVIMILLFYNITFCNVVNNQNRLKSDFTPFTIYFSKILSYGS